jgi:hypothetical protein
MPVRSNRALLLLASATLLLLPNCLSAWGAPPTAGEGVVEWPATLAPDDEPLGDPPPSPPPSNKPPVIRNFTHTAVGTVVTFTGRVEDENPGGLTVRLGGPAAMDNKAVTTDAAGYFTLTVNMGGQTGEVWARTTDREGLESASVYTNVY